MKKIEEVARAIATTCEGDPSKWEAWTHEARAAIEAVRAWQLTDAQCDAGFKAGEFAGHGPEHPQWNAMRRIFSAIIDAALNEGDAP